MVNINIDKIRLLSDKKIWLIFFSYILFVTLLIQLIILPYLLPQWHAGDGLIIGGDFVRFHRYAENQAIRVEDLGWDVFTLYPKGQFVSGIASVFYILFFPLPAVVLPLNAILHATAGLILFKILTKITQDRFLSLAGAVLFIIFPSALRWVSQMHNDLYSILGALLFLYGWVQLETFVKEKKTRNFGLAAFNILFGLLLIALVRLYLIDVYLMASLILGLYLILRTFITLPFKSAWTGISLVVLLILTQGILGEEVFQPQVRALRRREQLVSAEQITEESTAPLEIIEESTAPPEIKVESIAKLPKNFYWVKSTFLPSWLDDQVAQLILKRIKVIRNWSDGSTDIDTEVDLSSSMKTLLYMPRALQIALFAPFPTDWFEEGTKAPSNFMKRAAIFETSFVYLLFLFLPLGIKKWRSNSVLHLMLLYSLYFLTIYAIATPNVGNLYRFRYPYFIVLVAFSGASLAYYGFKLKK